ncbi:MAG: hypothetical protein QOG80_3081 [Pseudonocardiales bacterium]|nr:hypothetical protein [Pseudonocardiales bacterium]
MTLAFAGARGVVSFDAAESDARSPRPTSGHSETSGRTDVRAMSERFGAVGVARRTAGLVRIGKPKPVPRLGTQC